MVEIAGYSSRETGSGPQINYTDEKLRVANVFMDSGLQARIIRLSMLGIEQRWALVLEFGFTCPAYSPGISGFMRMRVLVAARRIRGTIPCVPLKAFGDMNLPQQEILPHRGRRGMMMTATASLADRSSQSFPGRAEPSERIAPAQLLADSDRSDSTRVQRTAYSASPVERQRLVPCRPLQSRL
jgi:hypothetical protein